MYFAKWCFHSSCLGPACVLITIFSTVTHKCQGQSGNQCYSLVDLSPLEIWASVNEETKPVLTFLFDFFYRDLQEGLQNIVKKDPVSARQNS